MKVKLVSVVTLLVLLLGACSVPKNVVYFQGMDALTPEQMSKMNQAYTSKICPDDLLTITVAAWDPAVVTPFSPPIYAYTTRGETTTISSGQLRMYLVDQESDINFPVLGKIHVAGLIKRQLGGKIQEMISPYMKNALIDVQIANYRVTMVGEVFQPGAISVKGDRFSILDAIGRVGDLTISTNRKSILVIRDNSGEKEFTRLGIAKLDIFTSPYYYPQQNDIVYVEPNNARKRNARYSQTQQCSITMLSSILSAISMVTTVILAITK